MRFESFNTSEQKPLGVGEDKETYINPVEQKRVISVIKEKEGIEKNSPNWLKGSFYLTKIAHLLLPNNIPEIYQVGESSDGKQTFDRERIEHSKGHSELQSNRLTGMDTKAARDHMIEEMGGGMSEVTLKMSDIGLGFNIDENVGNYSKDEKGNVYYLETFAPWENDVTDSSKLELIFDEEELREAIGRLDDENIKKICEDFLERLLALFKEEQIKLKEKTDAELDSISQTSEKEVQAFDAMIEIFEAKHDIEALFAVLTLGEALASADRASAKEDLVSILQFLNSLGNENKITKDQFASLYPKYQKISRAVGIVSFGKVDHER